MMLQKILELFCKNCRFTKFMGIQKQYPLTIMDFISASAKSFCYIKYFLPVFFIIRGNTGYFKV